MYNLSVFAFIVLRSVYANGARRNARTQPLTINELNALRWDLEVMRASLPRSSWNVFCWLARRELDNKIRAVTKLLTERYKEQSEQVGFSVPLS
jgi:hypothetical protein